MACFLFYVIGKGKHANELDCRMIFLVLVSLERYKPLF